MEGTTSAPRASPKSPELTDWTIPPTPLTRVSSSRDSTGDMCVMWWVAPLSMTHCVERGGEGGAADPENAKLRPGEVQVSSLRSDSAVLMVELGGVLAQTAV